MLNAHIPYTTLTTHLLQVVRTNGWDITQANLANLLTMMKLAQQPMYRNSYYNYCCFLTRFCTIYHKPYLSYMSECMPYMKFTTVPSNHAALWGLESYYYTCPDIYTLSADDLYFTPLDYKFLLPYKSYVFRADMLGYMVLWSDIERVRQKKYNEYVRTHYLLNSSAARHGRASCLAATNYRIPNANVHRGIYPALRTKHANIPIKQGELRTFVHAAITGGHRVLMLKVSGEGVAPVVCPQIGHTTAHKIATYYQNSACFSQRWTTLHLGYNHLLSNAVLCSLWLGDSYLGFDYVFRTYPQFFPSQMRLGLLAYIDYPIVSSLTHRIYAQMVALYGAMIRRREVNSLINNPVTQGYLTYTAMSGLGEQVPVVYHWSHSCLQGIMSSQVLNPQPLVWVHSTWLRWHKKRIPRIRNWTNSDLAYASTLTVQYVLWGKYYKITDYLSKVWMGNNYFYLRSFNYSLLNQAHYGRLHWQELLHALNIDKFIHLQLGAISEVIVHVWTKLAFTKNTDQLEGGRAPYEGVHRGLTHVSFGYVNWCNMYSYITVHAMATLMAHMQNYLPQLHGRVIHSILRRHMAIRRYLLAYRTKWHNYRRYPYNYGLGTCIHSVSPLSRDMWLEHVNWMRIIGLKKEQLPYYNYDAHQDYLTPLTQRGYAMSYGSGVFVIDKALEVAHGRNYPHIDKITMLYTHTTI